MEAGLSKINVIRVFYDHTTENSLGALKFSRRRRSIIPALPRATDHLADNRSYQMAVLIVGDRLLNLGPCIHNEGAILNYRLA